MKDISDLWDKRKKRMARQARDAQDRADDLAFNQQEITEERAERDKIAEPFLGGRYPGRIRLGLHLASTRTSVRTIDSTGTRTAVAPLR